MEAIRNAILSGADSAAIAALPIPATYRGAHVRLADVEMFAGVASDEKDPRKSIHVGEVPTPELAPDEVYVAVMASSINFNTVWSSIFEPIHTFGPMQRLGRESEWAKRHDRDYQVIGSDASGVVLKVGA
ncbi:MAG: crotonyl-CoA carboxylase/reductase, partial [Actinomycetes bacterium]